MINIESEQMNQNQLLEVLEDIAPKVADIGVGTDQQFERIRRITGYLVGSMDKWNDAKKEEEKDRVKHCTENTIP